MTGLLWLGFVAGVTTLLVWFFKPHRWGDTYAAVTRAPKVKDRAQRRGGTGHFLVLVGPDRCRCGASWPCMDSVAADRLTRQI